MEIRDITFDSPEENILFDDVLLDLAEEHDIPETIRFWESPRVFAVLGRICKEEDDLILSELQTHHIPILRRRSGGGTVLQGPGCMNYTLILSKDLRPDLNDLQKSYQYILSRVVEALAAQNIQASYFPISDIALMPGQFKVSGNAQRRKRKFILHHGTMLYSFKLDWISQFLKQPPSQPDYRKQRVHQEFIKNADLNPDVLKKDLCRIFGAQKKRELSPGEKSLLTKYCQKSDLLTCGE